MSEETLDLSSLENAIRSFERALHTLQHNSTDDEYLRDSCIKRFEYCYELVCKTLRRYLKIISASPEVIEQMSFQDIIREGYKKGLLKHSWDRWHSYRENRNKTSHAYDEEIANTVLAGLWDFYRELDFFLAALTKEQ